MKLVAGRMSVGEVSLEPLSEAHREGLRTAANSGLDWDYMPLEATGAVFDQWFDASVKAHESGSEIVFAVVSAALGIAGSTRYLNIVPEHRRCEIGHTWYSPAAQGGVVNPGAKYLLFGQAFAQGAGRVELKCDALNARSRAAIAKLGAKEEGIFRQHMVMPSGRIRDSVYFSVIATEWPEIREKLLKRATAG